MWRGVYRSHLSQFPPTAKSLSTIELIKIRSFSAPDRQTCVETICTRYARCRFPVPHICQWIFAHINICNGNMCAQIQSMHVLMRLAVGVGWWVVLFVTVTRSARFALRVSLIYTKQRFLVFNYNPHVYPDNVQGNLSDNKNPNNGFTTFPCGQLWINWFGGWLRLVGRNRRQLSCACSCRQQHEHVHRMMTRMWWLWFVCDDEWWYRRWLTCAVC